MKILVIVPAYNEQGALGGLLAELRAQQLDGDTLATLVVDDGSRDRTAEIARGDGARVLQLSHNLGIGAAVQSGIRLAHREGFDCAVQMDGDGQHPPAELARLLAPMRGAQPPDLVVGTRFGEGTEGFRSTLLRRLGSWWLRVVLRVVARLRVSDPTSGFRIYGARALALFHDTYPYDYPEPESLAIARAAGLRIEEVQVTMRERQGGRSSIAGLSTVYYMLKVTLAIVLTYFRARRRET